jgi:hypothetical protein
MKMPFGVHKGKEIGSIPRGYLRWVQSNVKLFGDLEVAINCVLERKPIPASPDVDAIVDSVVSVYSESPDALCGSLNQG